MAKIIGIGDNVVDINLTDNLVFPGGQALNVAANAAIQGSEAAYIGSIGIGGAAECVKKCLSTLGVDYSRCRYYPVPNFPSYYRIIDEDRVFVDPPSPLHPMTYALFDMIAYEGFSEDDYRYINKYDVVHLSNDSRIEALLPEFKKRKIEVSFDFSIYHDRPGFMESVCPYVKFAFYSASHMNKEEIKELLHKSHALGTEKSVATMGSEGAICFDGMDFYYQNAVKIEKVVDTMGAGDGFTSALLVKYYDCLHGGEPEKQALIKALEVAASYAGEVCMRQGAIGFGQPYNGTID